MLVRLGLTSGASLNHEATHGRHESHSHRVRLWSRARCHAAVRRCQSSFRILFRGARRHRLGRCDMHWTGRQGSADPIAGRPHIPRLLKYKADYILRGASFLFEDGRFQLDDPIAQFIPQLANRRVLRPGATSLDQTEPAVRPITIRHLMSHSSGLSYGLLDPDTLIFNAYNERKVVNPATTLAQMMDVLADLPLVFHPGTSWEYSVATDVLARLVEVISGRRFDAFIQSRILGPLGMVDTGFVVSDRNRLVAFYAGADPVDPMKPGLNRADDAPYPGAYLRPVPRQSGGSGLVSTLP